MEMFTNQVRALEAIYVDPPEPVDANLISETEVVERYKH
jgi:hypothetical protein